MAIPAKFIAEVEARIATAKEQLENFNSHTIVELGCNVESRTARENEMHAKQLLNNIITNNTRYLEIPNYIERTKKYG